MKRSTLEEEKHFTQFCSLAVILTYLADKRFKELEAIGKEIGVSGMTLYMIYRRKTPPNYRTHVALSRYINEQHK